MCGRYTLASADDAIAEVFELAERPSLAPRWNVAPSQPVAVVRVPHAGARRELALLRWGMGDRRSINARAETAADLRAFRDAFRWRRCLVPADGFYEWQKAGGPVPPGRPRGGMPPEISRGDIPPGRQRGDTPRPRPRARQAWYFRVRDVRVFAFAGLWDAGPRASGGDAVVAPGAGAGGGGGAGGAGGGAGGGGGCAILTTGANDLVRPVHDRMPVIVDARDYPLWLDPDVREAERLRPLLAPFPADRMEARLVGARVNNPRNDGPDLVQCVS